MASPKPPPTSPADSHDAAPPPLSLHRPPRRLWPRSREGNGLRSRSSCLPRPGLRRKKVAIHSSWITLVDLFLVRLATADTSGATEARIFAIAGAGTASLPWLLIFLSTAAITFFLEAGICDLTWIFSESGGGPPQRKRRQDRSMEDDGDDEAIDAAATTAGGRGEAADGPGKERSGSPSAGNEASTSAVEEVSPP